MWTVSPFLMVNVPFEDKQSKFMKNSKKFYKNPKTSRAYFQPNADEMVTSESHGENSLVEVSTALPAIAIVAPQARQPPNHGIMNSSVPCKPPPTMSRTMHVTQHHIHHIQPVQISTTLSPPPAQGTNLPPTTVNLSQPPPQTTPVWPVVEPAFHFGAGFEIHQSYCPTHSRPHADQHIVMFYLSPGVAASFQIAGGHKILQGESLVLSQISAELTDVEDFFWTRNSASTMRRLAFVFRDNAKAISYPSFH